MGERVKFYMDEHVPRAVIEGLRRRGVDVRTVSEAGMLRAPDDDHLKLAHREGRVMFTQDEDFLRLHAAGTPHAGIVYIHQQSASISVMVHGLILIYEVLEADEMENHLEFL